MKRKYTRLSGQELARILPEMHEMRNRGALQNEISRKYGLERSTVSMYLMDYASFRNGGEVRQIGRAIPYLVVQQAKMKFTEQHGRQPEQRGSYTKPKQQEVKRTQLSVLWGLLKINW